MRCQLGVAGRLSKTSDISATVAVNGKLSKEIRLELAMRRCRPTTFGQWAKIAARVAALGIARQ
eukprot:6139023-Amphidinium_carterae.1